jgi:hypothetical protein
MHMQNKKIGIKNGQKMGLIPRGEENRSSTCFLKIALIDHRP